MAEERSDTGVRSVQLALDVLEAIAFSGEELGVTQLADRLHVTKGSIHRHLITLVERGYLTQNPVSTRYGLGPKSRLLARIAPRVDMVQAADAVMRELRDALGHSVVLSAATPRGALVMAAVTSTAAIEIGVRPGSELPMLSSAQGRILLAHMSVEARMKLLEKPVEKLTAKTITDRAQLAAEIDHVRNHGFASAPEQALLGVNALAVPIYDDRNACVGTLALVGSIQHLPAEPDTATVAALQAAAWTVSQRLGHGVAGQARAAGGQAAVVQADARTPKRRRAG